VLGDRFELESLAGAGGMGKVYRARDRETAQQVAVKVLAEHAQVSGRFAREIQVLAGLDHPGIVRYVAHGETADGRPYLAMEWLEGEDLSRRLSRGPLEVSAAVDLAKQVAATLAVAHARGVVHRDLKPANLWLCTGEPSELPRIKVLDFGIAHQRGLTGMTRTGAVLGTPGYMAPEQAGGTHKVDARTDIFALGCVLFECLTGEPAFRGDNLMAVLAKTLFQSAPRLQDVRRGAPDELDALLANMLAKSQDDRPHDGAALLRELDRMPLHDQQGVLRISQTGQVGVSLTASERRMMSVLLIAGAVAPDVHASTLSFDAAPSTYQQLQRLVLARDGRLELLADGTAVATFAQTARVASDQAVQAARCALDVQALGVQLRIALATGRTEITQQLPLGDAIDRAAHMLAHVSAGSAVAIDAVTAGLLDARFEVASTDARLSLLREHPLSYGTRTLLGKPTQCVGRDAELSILQTLWRESSEEPLARAVLVTAPAGVGKSRLASELVRRLRDEDAQMSVWLARADSLRAGSAFGLISQILRSAIGLSEAQPLDKRRCKLRARAAENLPEAERERVTAFLGELAGVPFPDDLHPALRTARRDAQVMGEQMLSAWIDFARAETRHGPVLLLLEDLHWGDLPTVRFLDSALQKLDDAPLMVLALARPEVHELFPRLWAERRMQELRLRELTRKASEGLVRQVLGDAVSPDTVERLVAQAEGHAFYLEELIRAVAEGHGDVLPETVLAMVQARLTALDPHQRQLLRAASIFGEVCWQSALASLLGPQVSPTQVELDVDQLRDRELLVERSDSRFAGEREYGFRHALLREGAYATLTAADQTLGHRLAGEWLEQHGETDSLTLAEHFERGGLPDRAAHHYLQAARQANTGGDLDAAIARARRGLALPVTDATGLALHELLVEAHTWGRMWHLAEQHAEHLLAASSTGRARVVASMISFLAGLSLGRAENVMRERLQLSLETLEGAVPDSDNVAALAMATGSVTYTLDLMGAYDRGSSHFARMQERLGPLAEQDSLAKAWLAMPASHSGLVRGEAWLALQGGKRARDAFQRAGHSNGRLLAEIMVGINAYLLGAYSEALASFQLTSGVNLSSTSAMGAYYEIATWLALGDIDRAAQKSQQLLTQCIEHGSHSEQGRAHLALARVALARGQLEQAEREAQEAVAALLTLPADQVEALLRLASIQLARGEHVQAARNATAADVALAALRARGYGGPLERLRAIVAAERLRAAGDEAGALEIISKARENVLVQARAIEDERYRARFLGAVPENVSLLGAR